MTREAPTTVNMAELAELIKASILSDQPILIQGAPGIGKSAAAEQALRAFPNPDGSPMAMILTHPVVADPTDVKGFPAQFVNEDGTTFADFIPYGDLRQAMEATKPTLWFIDDFGQATPSVQAGFMQLLLAREVNGKKISPNIRFIAATNRKKDKSGVSGLLDAVKSRFGMIVELEADIQSFTDWATKSDILPSIVGYLKFSPSSLHVDAPNMDMSPSPCPRSWEKLSNTLKALDQIPTISKTLRNKAIKASVGKAVAREYINYEQMYNTLPDIDRILLNPDSFPMDMMPDQLFACCSAIAAKCTTDNFGNIVKIAKRMPREFAKMLVEFAKEKCPEIVNTPAFVTYSVEATAELGRI